MERTWSCFDCQFDSAEPLCFTEDGAFAPTRLARVLLKITMPGGAAEDRGDRMRAYDCVDELMQAAPDEAVTFLLAALEECKTPDHVALLGAGALETLLKAHGPRVIGALERAAERQAKVRYLLSSTWGEPNIAPTVWRRIIAAIACGPVMDADPRTPASGMVDKVLAADAVARLLTTPMT